MIYVRVEVYDKLNEACMDRCHFDTLFSRVKIKKNMQMAQKNIFLPFLAQKWQKMAIFGHDTCES